MCHPSVEACSRQVASGLGCAVMTTYHTLKTLITSSHQQQTLLAECRDLCSLGPLTTVELRSEVPHKGLWIDFRRLITCRGRDNAYADSGSQQTLSSLVHRLVLHCLPHCYKSV